MQLPPSWGSKTCLRLWFLKEFAASQARSLHVQKLLVLIETCLTQSLACIINILTMHAACLLWAAQHENADAAGHTMVGIIPSESYVEQNHSRIDWEVHLYKSVTAVSPGLQCLQPCFSKMTCLFPLFRHHKSICGASRLQLCCSNQRYSSRQQCSPVDDLFCLTCLAACGDVLLTSMTSRVRAFFACCKWCCSMHRFIGRQPPLRVILFQRDSLQIIPGRRPPKTLLRIVP